MLKERFRDIVRIMKKSTNVLRIRLAAISLTLSGIFFVLYPVIRPFSDESSLQGAEAFASFSFSFGALASFEKVSTTNNCGVFRPD